MGLDRQRALNELGIPEAMYDELLSDLLKQVDDGINVLNEAVAANDLDTITQVSHSIKGSAGNLRVNSIYITAKELESAAKGKKDINVIKEDLERLKTAFAGLKKEVG